MKTAIYIEDGVMQLALTPENDFEQSAIKDIKDNETLLTVKHGSFYYCQGGWHKQGDDKESLMLKIEKAKV